MIKRKKTKKIKVGEITVGGDAPIRVQSMTNTYTSDVASTLDQIRRLEDAGCELIRVAVPDRLSALSLGKLKSKMKAPLIADIHFDYRLALISIKEGVDGIRINPGNIGSKKKVEEILRKAKEMGVAIRIHRDIRPSIPYR